MPAILMHLRCLPLSHDGHCDAFGPSICEPTLTLTPARPALFLQNFLFRDLRTAHKSQPTIGECLEGRWKVIHVARVCASEMMSETHLEMDNGVCMTLA